MATALCYNSVCRKHNEGAYVSKLHLVRHAECEFNVRHLVQGWADSPVAELGIRQSRAAGDYIREAGIRPTHAYCSTSYRTEVTLREALGQVPGFEHMPYERLDDLREAYFGLLEGMPSELVVEQAPFGNFLVQFGGESQDHLGTRICGCLDGIMRRPDHESVIAVTHGAAARVFLDRWAADSPLWSPEFFGCPSNCSVMTFEYSDGEFELVNVFEPHVA